MLSINVAAQSIARVSAILLPAGAWDVMPLEIVTAGAERGELHFTYTEGAQAGGFDFQIHISGYSLDALISTGAAIWDTQALYAAGVLAAGVDTTSATQRELITYTVTGAGAESFVYGPFAMSNVERMRVRARESGDVANPGVLQIDLRIA